jgi:hypothetical protein
VKAAENLRGVILAAARIVCEAGIHRGLRLDSARDAENPGESRR